MAITKANLGNYRWEELAGNPLGGLSSWWEFGAALNRKAKQLAEQGDCAGSELFRSLQTVAHLMPTVHNTTRPYHHVVNGIDAMDCLNSIPDEHLDALSTVVPRLQDPQIRARYADVLWLKGHGHEFARIAVEANLQPAERSYNSDAERSVDERNRFVRALQLARSLNDDELLGETASIVQGYAAHLIQGTRSGSAMGVDIYCQLAVYDRSNRQNYDDKIVRGIKLAESAGNTSLAETLHRMRIEALGTTKDRVMVKEARLSAADALINYAELLASDNNFLQAHTYVENAIKCLRLAGGQRERVDYLHKLLHEYGKKAWESFEWKQARVEMPGESLNQLNAAAEEICERLEGETLRDSLFILARSSESPDAEWMQGLVDQMKEETVWSNLVPSISLDDSGKMISRKEAASDNFWHQQMSQYRSFIYWFTIAPAIEKINSEHDVTLKDLITILQECPFVPPDRQIIFARGLLAGMQSDFLAVAHFLPPQLEHALRRILVGVGEITSQLTNRMIEEEYPLGTILRYEKLSEILDKSLVLDLKCLLVDGDGGPNLRNRVSHGLLPDSDFFSPQVNHAAASQADIMYLWWLTLFLCFNN